MKISRVGVQMMNGDGANDEEGEDEDESLSRHVKMRWPAPDLKSGAAPVAMASDDMPNAGSRAAPLLTAASTDRNHSASVVHAPWFAAVMAVACISFVCILVLLLCWCSRHRWTQPSGSSIIPPAPGAPPERGLPLQDIPSPSLRLSHVQPTVRRSRKGLYASRRGSNVSLTLSLPHSFDSSTSDFGHIEDHGTAVSVETLPVPGTTPSQQAFDVEWLRTASHYRTREELVYEVAHNEASLFKEFWEIPMNYASKLDIPIAGIAAKNRYQTILPNNSTRVVLPEINGDPLSTYINANHIKGNDGENCFIATQAPMAHTIIDFWRMVWHTNASGIVMITRLVEQGKSKCENYLPRNNDCEAFGPIHVCVSHTVEQEFLVTRQLLLRRNEEERLCEHMWFTGWPDHTTPRCTDSLVELTNVIAALRRLRPAQPVLVHCSAGLGRTGAFLTLYFACEQLRIERRVDVLGIVSRLRLDRGGLVQSNEQYEFVHSVLASHFPPAGIASLPPTPAPSSHAASNASRRHLHRPTLGDPPRTPVLALATPRDLSRSFEFPPTHSNGDAS